MPRNSKNASLQTLASDQEEYAQPNSELGTDEEKCEGTRTLLLMRGLPSCGKTTRSKELVAEGGVAFEFDEYFYTQVGTDPSYYDWTNDKLDDAREWNVARICAAIKKGESPIVIDDDNGLGKTTSRCVKFAVENGYQIEFREPTSAWWPQIRALLSDKQKNKDALKKWAQKLSLLNRGTHEVSSDSILRRMNRWREEISIEDILNRAKRLAPEPQSPK